VKIILIIVFLTVVPLLPSGGYDHGTSTGKGLLELDFTWNPFNIFDQGQSYVVLGYGLTDRLDLHGYYSIHTEGFHTYYTGLFYQFLRSEKIDLATAVGMRRNKSNKYNDLFFPQFLYTIKLKNGYSIGGSFVNLIDQVDQSVESMSLVIDVAFFIPLTRYLPLPDTVKDLKLGVGLFNPVTNSTINSGKFIPTYSIDIKFGRKN
jgi:hypothetical protein|tara:strand:- start:555 stop:1169 length:615 start_codon:yes stop_codon:yes gene_type:complete